VDVEVSAHCTIYRPNTYAELFTKEAVTFVSFIRLRVREFNREALTAGNQAKIKLGTVRQLLPLRRREGD
jgi:hypothetical protein